MNQIQGDWRTSGSLQDFYISTVSFDCLSHMDSYMAVAGCQIDSQWFSSFQSWWMLQRDSTDSFTRGRTGISCRKVEEHPRDKDQQIWSAQSWHQYHTDSVVSSNLQAWCSFENGNDVPILEKIEQASWSMLENHKRCSCKIWKTSLTSNC